MSELSKLIRALASKATPRPWGFYQPSEFPNDWRIARTGKYEDHDDGRTYIGRITKSHDPRKSGNGGRGNEDPLEENVALMVEAANAADALCAEIELLEASAHTDAILKKHAPLLEKLGRGVGDPKEKLEIEVAFLRAQRDALAVRLFDEVKFSIEEYATGDDLKDPAASANREMAEFGLQVDGETVTEIEPPKDGAQNDSAP